MVFGRRGLRRFRRHVFDDGRHGRRRIRRDGGNIVIVR